MSHNNNSNWNQNDDGYVCPNVDDVTKPNPNILK